MVEAKVNLIDVPDKRFYRAARVAHPDTKKSKLLNYRPETRKFEYEPYLYPKLTTGRVDHSGWGPFLFGSWFSPNVRGIDSPYKVRDLTYISRYVIQVPCLASPLKRVVEPFLDETRHATTIEEILGYHHEHREDPRGK